MIDVRQTGAWALAALVIAATVNAQASKFEKVEAEAATAMKQVWLETAKKAAEAGHLVLLRRAADEARTLGVTGSEIEGAETKLMKPRPPAAPKDAAAADEILAAALAAVAKAVDPVLSLEPPEPASGKFALHLARALEGDPKNAKKVQLLQKRASVAAAKKDWDTLRSIVMRASELDPDGYKGGKYGPAEQLLVKNGGIVVRGRTHLMQAHVVLPDGWSPKKKWPMFVAIVGANCAYRSLLDELTKAASKKPYILVIPMTIGNANELPFPKLPYDRNAMAPYAPLERREFRVFWDEQGISAVVGEIRDRFSGTEKFFMTGYSGGGFDTYYWLQRHSDELLGACLSSANYWTFGAKNALPPTDGGCPVLIVSGSLDQAGKERIFPQSDEGMEALKKLGFTRVERRHLNGRDHEAFYELGLELLGKTLESSKKK